MNDAIQDGQNLKDNLVLALPTLQQFDAQDEGAELLPDALFQEIQGAQQFDGQHEHSAMQPNLQVGFVRIENNLMAGPIFDGFKMHTGSQSSLNADLFRIWGTFFSPLGDPQSQIPVAINWAPFITAKA
jgi:hypothetical protein